MILENLNASYSNVPILLEVLNSGNTLCVRIYMQYSYIKDHQFALDSGRAIDPTPASTNQTASTLVGNILSATTLSAIQASGEAKVSNILMRENSPAPSAVIVLNTKLSPLTNPAFGTETYVWFGDHIVYLDVLQSSVSWIDHSLFIGYFESSVDAAYYIQPMVDIYATTLADRGNKYNDLYRDSKYTLFDIWVPYKTSTAAEAIVRIYSRKFGTIGVPLLAPDLANAFSDTYAPFKITGSSTITANTTNSYNVTLVDATGAAVVGQDADIYIDSYSGYLPKTRVSTSNGLATFNVNALGLVAGDTITLKLGFKNMRNLVPFTISVV